MKREIYTIYKECPKNKKKYLIFLPINVNFSLYVYILLCVNGLRVPDISSVVWLPPPPTYLPYVICMYFVVQWEVSMNDKVTVASCYSGCWGDVTPGLRVRVTGYSPTATNGQVSVRQTAAHALTFHHQRTKQSTNNAVQSPDILIRDREGDNRSENYSWPPALSNRIIKI